MTWSPGQSQDQLHAFREEGRQHRETDCSPLRFASAGKLPLSRPEDALDSCAGRPARFRQERPVPAGSSPADHGTATHAGMPFACERTAPGVRLSDPGTPMG